MSSESISHSLCTRAGQKQGLWADPIHELMWSTAEVGVTMLLCPLGSAPALMYLAKRLFSLKASKL